MGEDTRLKRKVYETPGLKVLQSCRLKIHIYNTKYNNHKRVVVTGDILLYFIRSGYRHRQSLLYTEVSTAER